MDMLHIPETHKTLKSMERYLRALRNEYDAKLNATIKDGVKLQYLKDEITKTGNKIAKYNKEYTKLNRVYEQSKTSFGKERESSTSTFQRMKSDFEKRWTNKDSRNFQKFEWSRLVDRNKVTYYDLQSEIVKDEQRQKTFKKLYGVKNRQDRYGKGVPAGYCAVMREMQKPDKPLRRRNEAEPRKYCGTRTPVMNVNEMRSNFSMR